MKFTTTLVVLAATALAPALAAPAPGISNSQPAKRFVSGYCGFHITQYQKNENGNGADYSFDIRMKDDIQDQIGGINGLTIPSLQTRSVYSELPNTLDITAGSLDVDPITFSYAGQLFDTGSSQCSLGEYDSGSRQADCGFSC